MSEAAKRESIERHRQGLTGILLLLGVMRTKRSGE